MNAEHELINLSYAWDRAMVTNDAEEIGSYMADDWTIAGTDGSVGGKTDFLALVASGTLSHNIMESHDLNVRVYGDTAVVIGKGVSGGEYQGHAFHMVERVTCVYVRQGGEWKCVHTHLSNLVEK